MKIVSEDNSVELVSQTVDLKHQTFHEMSVSGLSEVGQVGFVLDEMLETGDGHKTFVDVGAALPMLEWNLCQ